MLFPSLSGCLGKFQRVLFFGFCLASTVHGGLTIAYAVDDPEQYIIDYAVFYTPEAQANEGDGSAEAMKARIDAAFAGANEIFRESKTGIQLRLVATQVLPVNNSATDLDTVVSELSASSIIRPTMDAVKADSRALIVESMLPGAYAGIPLKISQARYGGSTFFGRRNFTGFTLAHETGHTLGGFHDALPSAATSLEFAPDGPNGNHFIGNSGQHWRTVMSVKLNSYRAPQGQVIETRQCNRFSNPDVLWDGVPTGEQAKTDVVKTFRYYAPFVSQAGELRTMPPGGDGNLPPVEEDPSNTVPPGEDEDILPEALPPKVALLGRPARNRNDVIVKASCRESDNTSPALGQRLTLGFIESRKLTVLKRTTCSSKGTVSFKLLRKNYRKGLIIGYQSYPQVKVKVPFDKNLVR
jgi:hypothetical protein